MENPGFGKITCIIAAFCLATAIGSPAQTFTTLLSFDGKNGNGPSGSLVQGTDGNFYGTTGAGGLTFNCFNPYGCGTVFEITQAGTVTTLHNFCPQVSCVDGYGTHGGLVQGANGSFYGTTNWGGTSNSDECTNGCGVVFEITPARNLSALYNFCSQPSCKDGLSPGSALVLGPNGNFYGTTDVGGANCLSHAGSGCGTVFEMTPTGKLTTLHSFCSEINSNGRCIDGMSPMSLVLASNGNFYGTTALGGDGADCDSVSGSGCGTIFEITPAGKLTTLYNFCRKAPCTDGQQPNGLLQADNGKLYGTTSQGGNTNNSGTVFEVTAPGKLRTLYSFCAQGGSCVDGQYPNTNLVQGTDGNFYGTTQTGGASGDGCNVGYCGTVFQITPQGALTTLHSFTGPDGSWPYGGVVQGTDGQFYGSTSGGGAYFCDDDNGSYCGTIFSLSMGLGPFVEANPNFGTVGKVITILGNNLTGTTAVTFDGTPATFEIVSSTYIKAKVPASATTGPIEITTPSGTLSSNVAFHVLP